MNPNLNFDQRLTIIHVDVMPRYSSCLLAKQCSGWWKWTSMMQNRTLHNSQTQTLSYSIILHLFIDNSLASSSLEIHVAYMQAINRSLCRQGFLSLVNPEQYQLLLQPNIIMTNRLLLKMRIAVISTTTQGRFKTLCTNIMPTAEKL